VVDRKFPYSTLMNIHDLATGKLIFSDRQMGRNSYTSVGWSPDGQLLAATVSGETPGMKVWDEKKQAIILNLPGTKALAGSPDGKRLAAVSALNPRAATVWEIPTGKEVSMPRSHFSSLVGVKWGPGGLLVASEDGSIKIWDANRHPEYQTLPGDTRPVNYL